MGDKTKIDWCDASWNPVTGCLHGCEYCYARGMAHRYAGFSPESKRGNGAWNTIQYSKGAPKLGVLNGRQYTTMPDGTEAVAPYPFDFKPTFHRYRLDIPQHWKRPRNIFVCSMADLFGDWVPDEWIQEVFKACEAAPWHRYLFLTKNPTRIAYLIANGILPEDQPNFWYGSTATIPEMEFFWHDTVNTFVSIEPILAPFVDLGDDGKAPASYTDWIIVGAETGNRKNRVIPEKSWVMELVKCARDSNTPIFMKESLREIMGDDFRQDYPWEVK